MICRTRRASAHAIAEAPASSTISPLRAAVTRASRTTWFATGYTSIGSGLPLTGTPLISRKRAACGDADNCACATAVSTISNFFATSAMRAATLTTSP